MTGIYKITNKINGKVYIGQSVDIFSRWKYHRTHLQNPTALHKALKKYGIENFTFEILEETPLDKNYMNEREIYYISYFNSYNKGYNETLGGNSSFNQSKNLTEQNVIDIRKRKQNGESPTKVFLDYENLIKYSTFQKIWQGEYFKQIMPELYQDKKFLKELEKNLKRGENHSSAILSEKEVIDIKTRRRNGEKRKDVFQNYKEKITINGFDGIWYNKKWKHIQV